jgi:hypothetical protein
MQTNTVVFGDALKAVSSDEADGDGETVEAGDAEV